MRGSSKSWKEGEGGDGQTEIVPPKIRIQEKSDNDNDKHNEESSPL